MKTDAGLTVMIEGLPLATATVTPLAGAARERLTRTRAVRPTLTIPGSI
jgi:hypothetical protein